MSLVAIVYHLVPDAPILVACNREESFCAGDRRAVDSIRKASDIGQRRLQDGRDATWRKSKRHVCRGDPRKKFVVPAVARLRGALCRNMLRCGSARQAVDLALEELQSDQYAGVNLVVADAESGWVIHGGNDFNACPLEEGLSIIGDRDIDDRSDERIRLTHRLLTLQMLDSPVKFLAVASKVFARAPLPGGRSGMVIREKDFQTVNSTLLSLGKKPRDAIINMPTGHPIKRSTKIIRRCCGTFCRADYASRAREPTPRDAREHNPKKTRRPDGRLFFGPASAVRFALRLAFGEAVRQSIEHRVAAFFHRSQCRRFAANNMRPFRHPAARQRRLGQYLRIERIGQANV